MSAITVLGLTVLLTVILPIGWGILSEIGVLGKKTR